MARHRWCCLGSLLPRLGIKKLYFDVPIGCILQCLTINKVVRVYSYAEQIDLAGVRRHDKTIIDILYPVLALYLDPSGRV